VTPPVPPRRRGGSSPRPAPARTTARSAPCDEQG
jgi:hypothetical protein